MTYKCHRLPNYTRTYRRRARLLQSEVALLMGHKSTSYLSRIERFHKMASLSTAFALSSIYKVPIEELFAGEYERLAHEIGTRKQTVRNREQKRP